MRGAAERTGARFLRVEPALFVAPALCEREVWETTRAEWLVFRRRAR